MAYRRQNDFEERESYSSPRRSRGDFEEEDIDIRRRTLTRSPPRSRAPTRVSDELDVDVRLREDRTPAFLRPDARRRDAGPMVLRQRDVETFDRRQRSPSRRPRSVVEETDVRVVERERERRRSPSPQPIRFVERERRARDDDSRERDHIRIVERERERIPSPSSSPSPPPPPPVIRGPVIERDVITHYTDIDHGLVRARRPSPPPPRPRERDEVRETDIDIQLSKGRHEIDVDVRRSTSRHRSRSRPRPRYYDDDLDIVVRDTERLRVDGGHRRSRSAAPLASPLEEESNYITGKIDSRGRMGEAWGGHTKDWTIVDVPPGTERVRMDGVGGGSTDTHWSRYSGVRRTQFVPERGDTTALVPVPRGDSRSSRSGGQYDTDRSLDIDIDISRHNSRPAPPPPPPPQKEMWTEITKDLVIREAIEEMGYRYEESGKYFYVMEYLRYDDVLQLTRITEDMRCNRYRRDFGSYRMTGSYDGHYHPKPRRSGRYEDERVTEVIYDSRRIGERHTR